MKYILFGLMLIVGVPLMTRAAVASEKARGWFVTALVFTPLVKISVNFMSTETYRGPDRGFEITLCDLIALSLILMMFQRFRDRIVWLPYNSWCLLVLFLLAVISAFGAASPLYSAFAIWKWYRAYVLFWCVVNVMRVEWDRRAIWRGLLGMAFWLSITCLKQKYLFHVYRVPGTFDHSNTVPLFLNQALPVLTLWGLIDKRLTNGQAALSLIGALGLCVSSQSTFSRLGSSLSLGCFLVALVVANLRTRGQKRVRVTTLLAVVAVVIGGLLALPSIMNRINSAPEESEQARAEFNRAAKDMARDHLFGVGVNNFPLVLTKESRYNQYISVMEDEEQAGVCHQIYNLTAAELGKFGEYVFVVILVRFALLPIPYMFRYRTLEATLLWSFLAGAIALHISGFAEWVFRITPVTYMYAICSGLAVGFVGQIKEAAAATRAQMKAPVSLAMRKEVAAL